MKKVSLFVLVPLCVSLLIGSSFADVTKCKEQEVVVMLPYSNRLCDGFETARVTSYARIMNVDPESEVIVEWANLYKYINDAGEWVLDPEAEFEYVSPDSPVVLKPFQAFMFSVNESVIGVPPLPGPRSPRILKLRWVSNEGKNVVAPQIEGSIMDTGPGPDGCIRMLGMRPAPVTVYSETKNKK